MAMLTGPPNLGEDRRPDSGQPSTALSRLIRGSIGGCPIRSIV